MIINNSNTIANIAPLVVMSIVGHHKRVALRFKSQRVVGVLLGINTVGSGNETHVTISFAIPFDEDPRDPSIWFSDPIYQAKLAYMMRKINGNETIVGW